MHGESLVNHQPTHHDFSPPRTDVDCRQHVWQINDEDDLHHLAAKIVRYSELHAKCVILISNPFQFLRFALLAVAMSPLCAEARMYRYLAPTIARFDSLA